MVKARPNLLRIIAIWVILGGVFGIVISIPFYSVSNSIKQDGLTTNDKVSVLSVSQNSPADQAQLKKGDTIISVNGTAVKKSADLTDVTNANQGKEVTITFERDGSTQTVQLIPRVNPPQNEGRVGLALTSGVDKKPLIQLIPQVIVKSYSGWEEAPVFYGVSTYSYQDKSFSRLRTLIFAGTLSLVIGFGLWKLKKWAIFGYLLLLVYGLSTFIISLVTLNSTNQVLIFNNSSSLIILCAGLLIQVAFLIYLFSKKNMFS